jgi:hypothetical protein
VRATADKVPGGFMTHSFAITYERVQREGWPIRLVAMSHDEVRDKAGEILPDLLPPDA